MFMENNCLFYDRSWTHSPKDRNGFVHVCQNLILEKTDFSKAIEGYKSSPTLVYKAIGGEIVETVNLSGMVKICCIANPGEVIMQNIHNDNDRYIAYDKKRGRWQYEEMMSRKDLTFSFYGGNTYLIKNQKCLVLHEVIDRNTCILNLFGENMHQFIYDGASLILRPDGCINGIDKDAFNATWSLLKP